MYCPFFIPCNACLDEVEELEDTGAKVCDSCAERYAITELARLYFNAPPEEKLLAHVKLLRAENARLRTKQG